MLLQQIVVAFIVLSCAIDIAGAEVVTFADDPNGACSDVPTLGSSGGSHRALTGVSDARSCAVECTASNASAQQSCAVFQFSANDSTCVLGSACDFRLRWRSLPDRRCSTRVCAARNLCLASSTDAATGATATTPAGSATTTTPATIAATNSTTPATSGYSVESTTLSSVLINESPGATVREGTTQSFMPAVATSCYRIAAWGASGGSFPPFAGGRGAYKSAYFALTHNDTLTIVVGKRGGNSSLNKKSGGGGGASFVYSGSADSPRLLLAAGGGGGAGQSNPGANGTNATGGTAAVSTSASYAGDGGINGGGGRPPSSSDTGSGGGGAGWLTAGESSGAVKSGSGGATRSGGWLGGAQGQSSGPGGYGGGGGGGSFAAPEGRRVDGLSGGNSAGAGGRVVIERMAPSDSSLCD